MTEQVGDGHEPLSPREQAEVYLLHAEHAQSQAGMQTLYLAAIAHLLRSLDDKLTLPEPDTMHADGYGAIRVFHSTDEVIDFLLNDQEPMGVETDRIIGALRETFPGVVDEWERQRADGNEDWPDYHDEGGLRWWLDSEVRLTEDFIPTDESGQETKLQVFCLAALNYLRHERAESD